MKKKSLGVTLISILIIFLGNLGGFFGEQGDIIVALIASTAVMVLKVYSDSGVWLKGMSATFWIVSTLGLLIQVGTNLASYADVLNISQSALAAIGKLTILLNAIIIGLGSTTTMHPGEKTLIAKK
jgi:hypothetical protein